MARLLRYTTTWADGDGNAHTLVYHREQDPSDISLAEARNKDTEDDMKLYQDACDSGAASAVVTTVEEVD